MKALHIATINKYFEVWSKDILLFIFTIDIKYFSKLFMIPAFLWENEDIKFFIVK